MGDRIEIIIERWTNPNKSTEYRWSIWRGGSRVHMGGPHASVEDSEHEAVEYCADKLKRAPDRIERL